MELTQIIQHFLDEDGQISLPKNFTIPALSEMLYASDIQEGEADRPVLRFWDYSDSLDGTLNTFTRADVNTRIKAVAARLMQVGQPGNRVAIMAGNSPEYLFGFLGALYAGQIPVPLYDPNEPGHANHLRAVLADADASAVLTNKAGAAEVRAYFAELPAKDRPRILAVDSLPDSLAQSWTPLQLPEDAETLKHTAFLQYTSGSTSAPAGVVLTNESLITNCIQIYVASGLKQPVRVPLWIPLHHDMGIMVGTLMMVLGNEVELMTPRDFIQQPGRYISQLSRREDDPDDISVYSLIPNFALDLAARYATPEALGDNNLDLSVVTGLIIGSESITEAGVDAFVDTFSGYGLRRAALRPGYGLAEATLIVTLADQPTFTFFDRDGLADGSLIAAPNGLPVASIGHPVPWMHLAIVDPDTHEQVSDGTVGEIWVHGANVAAGYYGQAGETRDSFNNTLNSSLAGDLPTEGWLATGDLAAIYDGEVYITGRFKELIVVAGRNHYPQDIEATVMEASDHVRPDSVAAFSVPGDDVERLVLFVERADGSDETGDKAAEDSIRAAVTATHGISPDVVEFYEPGGIARSSSGKIARRVNMKNFLER